MDAVIRNILNPFCQPPTFTWRRSVDHALIALDARARGVMVRRAGSSSWCWLETHPKRLSRRPQQQPQPSGGAPAPGREGAARGGGQGRGRGPAPVDTLGAGPWEFPAGRGGRMKVSVVTKGVNHPWGIAFLPDGGMLVTERPGRLRQIKNGVLDPTPIGPMPEMLATGLGGLLDVSLHPQFVKNRLIYLTYSKPGPRVQAMRRRRCCARSGTADRRSPRSRTSSSPMRITADRDRRRASARPAAATARGWRGTEPDSSTSRSAIATIRPRRRTRRRTSARSCASATMAACRRTIRSSAGRDTSPRSTRWAIAIRSASTFIR